MMTGCTNPLNYWSNRYICMSTTFPLKSSFLSKALLLLLSCKKPEGLWVAAGPALLPALIANPFVLLSPKRKATCCSTHRTEPLYGQDTSQIVSALKANQQSDHDCLDTSSNTLRSDLLAVSANRSVRPARCIKWNYMGNVNSRWDSYLQEKCWVYPTLLFQSYCL